MVEQDTTPGHPDTTTIVAVVVTNCAGIFIMCVIAALACRQNKPPVEHKAHNSVDMSTQTESSETKASTSSEMKHYSRQLSKEPWQPMPCSSNDDLSQSKQSLSSQSLYGAYTSVRTNETYEDPYLYIPADAQHVPIPAYMLDEGTEQQPTPCTISNKPRLRPKRSCSLDSSLYTLPRDIVPVEETYIYFRADDVRAPANELMGGTDRPIPCRGGVKPRLPPKQRNTDDSSHNNHDGHMPLMDTTSVDDPCINFPRDTQHVAVITQGSNEDRGQSTACILRKKPKLQPKWTCANVQRSEKRAQTYYGSTDHNYINIKPVSQAPDTAGGGNCLTYEADKMRRKTYTSTNSKDSGIYVIDAEEAYPLCSTPE